MSCNTFEKGFKKVTSEDYNSKQKEGKNGIIFFSFSIVTFVLFVIFTWMKKYKIGMVQVNNSFSG